MDDRLRSRELPRKERRLWIGNVVDDRYDAWIGRQRWQLSIDEHDAIGRRSGGREQPVREDPAEEAAGAGDEDVHGRQRALREAVGKSPVDQDECDPAGPAGPVRPAVIRSALHDDVTGPNDRLAFIDDQRDLPFKHDAVVD